MGRNPETAGGSHRLATRRKRLQHMGPAPVETSQGERNLMVDKALEEECRACLVFHTKRFLFAGRSLSPSALGILRKSDLYLGDLVSRVVEIDMQKRFYVNAIHL
jgi:hypothetical protein